MKKVFIFGDRNLMRNYAEVLDSCGGRSVFSENLEYAKDCGALLLPGGGDIDPARYHAENTASAGIDDRRDAAELELIRAFSVTRRPILGICRGHQILNVALGGDMIQNVENTQVHRWDEAVGDKVHKVTVSEESFLYPLYGREFQVNSAHHQAIGRLAAGLTPIARSEDGLIEAVENRERNIFAVQWHPERMAFSHSRTDTVDGRYIFEFFLKLCL